MQPLREDLDRILHDLRGPLNSAAIHLEILRRGVADDADALRSVATIQQELTRMAAMLQAAFGVVALERGDLKRCDLRALVQQAIDERASGPVEVADGPWPEVGVDGDLVRHAIGHLLDNAVRATREGPRPERPPRASVESDRPDSVTLVVRDWGRGFKSTNPAALIRLVGVGLITVERVARLHGGRLGFASHADGAEVRLTLPT